MPDNSDERWRMAFEATQAENQRNHRQLMVYFGYEFTFALLCLIAAVFLIYTGRWLGVLLAPMGTNLASFRRLWTVVRDWSEKPSTD